MLIQAGSVVPVSVPGNILGLINLWLPWLQANIVGLVPRPNLSPALLQATKKNRSRRKSGNEVDIVGPRMEPLN